MKIVSTSAILVAAVALSSGCTKPGPAKPSTKIMEIADQYCNEIAKPWMALASACRAEKQAGEEGANCQDLNVLMAEINRRQEASNLKECSGPRARIGHPLQ